MATPPATAGSPVAPAMMSSCLQCQIYSVYSAKMTGQLTDDSRLGPDLPVCSRFLTAGDERPSEPPTAGIRRRVGGETLLDMASAHTPASRARTIRRQQRVREPHQIPDHAGDVHHSQSWPRPVNTQLMCLFSFYKPIKIHYLQRTALFCFGRTVTTLGIAYLIVKSFV